MAQLVDWDLARQTGARLVPAGPLTNAAQARRLVEDLRLAAEVSGGHVREVTQLDPPETVSPTLVVDRPSWIRANCDSMRTLLGARGATSLAASAAGVETGAVLAILAPRVMGQFDPFYGPAGRLMLSAPNVLQASRQLDIDLADFMLWVCLHEQTHRVQFHTAPWLREYLKTRIESLTQAMTFRFADLVDWVKSCLARGGDSTSFMNLFIDPEHRAAVAEVAAVMTLLEGHAEVMMDRVGPAVIPSLRRIRSRFDGRRADSSTFLTRLLGMEAKRQQYRDGAAFCQAVIATVGVGGLNQVFAGPEMLPTMAEIRQPGTWLRRTGLASA